MSKLILKFGGKTISNFENLEHASNRVLEAINSKKQVIVVVSAMGDETDQLVELAAKIDACGYYREMDQLLATGEMKASALMTMTLKNKGINAKSLNFANTGITTDTNYFNAQILDINTKKIEKLLDNGEVPVVAGYQGINQLGDVTTLGRGGSDITAVKLAAALKAECILFKDVGAVYESDPKINDSKKISKISIENLQKLLGENPKVIHKISLDIAKKEQVKIKIANPETFEIGTVIE